jgi:hypothetical protein
MVVDRRLGEKKMLSPNYDESYIITRTGTWVPTADVERLCSIKLLCPMLGERITAFGVGMPSAQQMAQMPSRSPKRKPRKRRTYKVETEQIEVSTEVEDVDTKEIE